jgi:hypothetical protein
MKKEDGSEEIRTHTSIILKLLAGTQKHLKKVFEG